MTTIAKAILIIIGMAALGICCAAAKEWQYSCELCFRSKGEHKLSDHLIHLYLGMWSGGVLMLCVYLYSLLGE